MQLNEEVNTPWEISFTVHGEPRPWQRAIPIGKGAAINTKRNAGYQTQIAWSCKAAMTTARVRRSDGPLILYATFFFIPPVSWSKSDRAAALANEMACVVRCDTDNLVKNIGDGLNTIAFDDDHQIVDVIATRRWDLKPRAEVTLREWRPGSALPAR